MTTVPTPGPAHPARIDWTFVCTEPGAVISMSWTDERRPSGARAVAFMDSGQTYWFDSLAAGRPRSFDLRSVAVAGRHELRFTTRATELSGPVELTDDDGPTPVGRVPLILDVALTPMARPVILADPVEPAEAVPAQGFRVTGTLAVGSVLHRVVGQAWSSRSRFSTPDVEAGSRVQAVFQDDSSLVATVAGAEATAERSAALQVHHRISRMSVGGLRVHGPTRGVPHSVSAELGGAAPVEVAGAPRHVEGYQHVALLRSSRTSGEWVRVGYTPFDFVRAGITGFGLLEHVTPVDSLAAPAEEPQLPDPWD